MHKLCVMEHSPRDRKDSIYNRIFRVLCWLYVNISCKRKEREITLVPRERVKETSRSEAQALFLTNIYTASSQSTLSHPERPLGYTSPEGVIH